MNCQLALIIPDDDDDDDDVDYDDDDKNKLLIIKTIIMNMRAFSRPEVRMSKLTVRQVGRGVKCNIQYGEGFAVHEVSNLFPLFCLLNIC